MKENLLMALLIVLALLAAWLRYEWDMAPRREIRELRQQMERGAK